MQLKDKVVIVTGGYTGIGKAIVVKCLAEGAKLLVNGLREEKSKELTQAHNSDNLITHTQDITEDGAAKQLINLAIKKNRKRFISGSCKWCHANYPIRVKSLPGSFPGPFATAAPTHCV